MARRKKERKVFETAADIFYGVSTGIGLMTVPLIITILMSQWIDSHVRDIGGVKGLVISIILLILLAATFIGLIFVNLRVALKKNEKIIERTILVTAAIIIFLLIIGITGFLKILITKSYS